jgi:hypothetical protein
MAFSMAGREVSTYLCVAVPSVRTSETTQAELLQLTHLVGKLAVVSDDIEVIGTSKDTRKLGCL